jgi:hypothetical protein
MWCPRNAALAAMLCFAAPATAGETHRCRFDPDAKLVTYAVAPEEAPALVLACLTPTTVQARWRYFGPSKGRGVLMLHGPQGRALGVEGPVTDAAASGAILSANMTTDSALLRVLRLGVEVISPRGAYEVAPDTDMCVEALLVACIFRSPVVRAVLTKEPE